jgi:hypothetical protein
MQMIFQHSIFHSNYKRQQLLGENTFQIEMVFCNMTFRIIYLIILHTKWNIEGKQKMWDEDNIVPIFSRRRAVRYAQLEQNTEELVKDA